MRKIRLPRRDFLRTMSAAGVLAHAEAFAATFQDSNHPARITEVAFDLARLHKWDNSNGDTWDPFWADDGNLYAFNCDGRGFGTQPRNLAFNRLVGDNPESLTGQSINSMDEYGKANQKEADNATWKACGQECIDSIFYAFVSRNVYGGDSKDPLMRQTAFNSSLIKSIDRGRTWTPSAAQNYAKPMWPGSRFGSPFFVHYGKNGGQVPRDSADGFVYAISSNGFWNDGDNYILGRVERRKLPDLNPADWTYFSETNTSDSSNWVSDPNRATPILSLPARCGQTPPCFIASLGLYLLVSWYNTSPLKKWFEPNEMRYDFYQAEHLRGPWSFINSHSDSFLGDNRHMYGPSLCAKFQERRGSEVRLPLFTSGCPFEDTPSGFYKLWYVPLILKTEASSGPK